MMANARSLTFASSRLRYRVGTACAVVLLALVGVGGSLRAEPHPHHGVLTPFEGRPPKLTLDAKDLATLDAGGVVRKRIDSNSDGAEGGRGMVVQDIDAPPDVVWDRILDFDAYPRMVDDVHSLDVYERNPGRVKARFVLSTAGLKLEYFVDHVVNQQQGYLTWTLDYSKKSELDDVVGYWFVEPHPTRPGWTRLYYSVDIRVKGWVPHFIEELVREQGLTRATQWVKREAEAQAKAKAKAPATTKG